MSTKPKLLSLSKTVGLKGIGIELIFGGYFRQQNNVTGRLNYVFKCGPVP